MNNINSDIKSQANEAALLNVLMYLDIHDVESKNGYKLSKILDNLGDIYGSSDGYNIYIKTHPKGSMSDYQDRQRQYQMLVNASKSNEHLANMVIGNQSRLMTNPSYESKGLNAFTFTDIDGNVIVVFRGTGSGEWIDNGKGLAGIITDTPQQMEAAEYFDRIVEKNNYNNRDINIVVAGHSKGGNKAQYTTINSQYKDLISLCYNFDGQGMSPEAIAEFKRRYGEEAYNEALSKMYGFYAENDFVNPLGVHIVPEGHRYYFENPIVNGIDDYAKNHYADGYLNIDGSFTNQTDQGNLSKVIQNFSTEIANLPPEIRSKVAYAVMGIMQGKKETVNGDKVSWTDYAIGLPIAIPTLLVDLLGTPSGWATIVDLVGDSLDTVEEKYGVGAKWVAAAAVTFTAIVFAPSIIKAVGVATFINVCEFAVGKLIELGKLAVDFAKRIADTVVSFVGYIKDWFGSVFGGGNAGEFYHSDIKVNTYRLRYYADRLTALNRRISYVDSSLDRLYTEVGIDDLWSLIKADALTGYSWRIRNWINYLNNAAEDFERIEARLVSQINS